MKGHGQKLSRKKEQAIVALLAHPTVGQAATAVGIGESTMFRWLQRDDFRQAYRLSRHEALGQALARMHAAASEAVSTLREVMTDTTAPASTRVSAARSVVELAIKAVELEDIEARVAELERRTEQCT